MERRLDCKDRPKMSLTEHAANEVAKGSDEIAR